MNLADWSGNSAVGTAVASGQGAATAEKLASTGIGAVFFNLEDSAGRAQAESIGER